MPSRRTTPTREEQVCPVTDTPAAREAAMPAPERRRQQGLIREALWIFLVIAILMAVMLDGFAIFTAQRDARGDAADAGSEAKQKYVETGRVDLAEKAARTFVQDNGGEFLDFSSSAGTGPDTRSFTVTVRYRADTYLFHYLGYMAGLKDWVRDVENPTITRTTS